jgi:ORF6N domain
MSVLSLVPVGRITSQILVLRGQNVLLDSDIAKLYRVPTRRLNEQVRRNIQRFPADFMFQLVKEEDAALRSQIATSKRGRGGRRYLPLAFTEQGVAMLSSVLKSQRAILVNIEIMRAFVRLRQMANSHADLARRLNALESRYDAKFKEVFDAIRQLMEPPPPPPRPRIGFGR